MDIYKAGLDEAEFIFECLKELRGSVDYKFEDFVNYAKQRALFEQEHSGFYVGREAGILVGMLTCHYYAIPRFLGFGFELEEVVVHPIHQGKGLGKKLIEGFIQQQSTDPLLRKIIVKTDDLDKAGQLYKKYFSTADMTVFTKNINYI